MTDKMMHFVLIKLKVIAVALLLAMFSFFLFSFKTSQKLADDVWTQLGLNKQQGLEKVRRSFFNGYLDYYGVRNAKNIATGNRAAVAKDLLTYTKQYLSSDVFKKAYELDRQDTKPPVPDQKAKTKEEIRAKQIADMEKGIKSTEETIKKMPEMEKALRPNVDMFAKLLKEYKDPNNKDIEAMYQNELREEQERQRSYEERYAKWEKEYPADVKQLVKTRLQKYLALANTVDFNAELKEVGKKFKFVNPQYEGKAYDWKQIFRAGKEVYDVAKPFAESWIKELDAIK
jgi:hypothetical protein